MLDYIQMETLPIKRLVQCLAPHVGQQSVLKDIGRLFPDTWDDCSQTGLAQMGFEDRPVSRSRARGEECGEDRLRGGSRDRRNLSPARRLRLEVRGGSQRPHSPTGREVAHHSNSGRASSQRGTGPTILAASCHSLPQLSASRSPLSLENFLSFFLMYKAISIYLYSFFFFF